MKINKRWYWLTERTKFDDMSVHQAFDIIRYDGARLESNPPEDVAQGIFYYMFSSAGDYPGPNLDRLRSYHLAPAWVSHAPLSHDNATYEAAEFHYREMLKRVAKRTQK